MSRNKRYVFDANAIISALLLPDSVPRQALDKALQTGKIHVSLEILNEIEKTLSRDKFKAYIDASDRIQFMIELVKEAVLVENAKSVKACRDPKDDMYLAIAVACDAGCIVTGDKDLLSMRLYEGIKILNPRQFVELGVITQD